MRFDILSTCPSHASGTWKIYHVTWKPDLTYADSIEPRMSVTHPILNKTAFPIKSPILPIIITVDVRVKMKLSRTHITPGLSSGHERQNRSKKG